MVSRSELDMLDIREIFRTKYEKSLYSMIKVSGTSRAQRMGTSPESGSLLGAPRAFKAIQQRSQSLAVMVTREEGEAPL